MKKQCASCMVTGKEFIGDQMTSERSLNDINMVKMKCMTAPRKSTLRFRVENERVEEFEVGSARRTL